jgi:transcriptional regulator with XRE-family HTH domain
MSIIDFDFTASINGQSQEVAVAPASAPKPLHRLAAVRAEQKLSPATLARRLNTTSEQVRRQEQETTDLPLSVLYQWAGALEVPVQALLVDRDYELPLPRLEFGQAVELFKTARAICEGIEHPNLQRVANSLVEQLLEIAPELKDAGPLLSAQKRRGANRAREIVVQELPENVFIKPIEEH